jgi:hypothetical protein
MCAAAPSNLQEIGMILRNGGMAKPQRHHLQKPKNGPLRSAKVMHAALVFMPPG